MVRATTFSVETSGPGIHDMTQDIAAWVEGDGLLTLFIRHTSASLLIQENADQDVQRDFMAYLERLVPPADDSSMDYLRHRSEGPDDMPAHIKAALLPVSVQIPVENGVMRLGKWQAIYLVEHRTQPRRREVAAHLA